MDIQTIPFSFKDKEYEILVWSDGATIRVKAFHKGWPQKAANGFCYEIGMNQPFDFKKLTGLDLIKEFIELAKNDIIQKRYERLLEAIEEVSSKKEEE